MALYFSFDPVRIVQSAIARSYGKVFVISTTQNNMHRFGNAVFYFTPVRVQIGRLAWNGFS